MQVAEHGQNPEVLIKRHHAWPWIVLLLLFLVVAACGVVAYQFYKQAMEVKDHEQHAVQMLQGMSGGSGLDAFDKMQSSLPQAQKETSEAKAITQGSLWNLAAKMPWVGGDIKNVQGMTDSVDSIMHNGLPQFVTIFNNLKGASLNSGDGQLNLQPIVDAQQAMQKANTSFQGDVRDFGNLPKPKIAPVNKIYRQADDKLVEMGNKVDQLTGMMNVLPQFLGVGQPKTYLIAAMTPSEARSSGGLVGSMGTMTADNGKITMGEFRSNSDYIPYGKSDPTQDESDMFHEWGPLTMSFDVRDTGAYPQTQRVAEGLKTIWDKTPWGAEENIDGVITVDPVFLQELNKINGGVKLQNGQVLDGNNTAEFLLNTVYKDYTPLEQDVYFAEVADQSMNQMFSGMDMGKLMKVEQSMTSMAKGRHFNVYAFDGNMEKPLDDAGFTAHIPNSEEKPSVGIYINNQVGSKMEWYLKRTTTVTQTNCGAQGGKTYHVEYHLDNTLAPRAVVSLPRYITGERNDVPLGVAREKLLLYGPAGGAVSNVSYSGATGSVNQKRLQMEGKPVQAATFSVYPGHNVTLSFDVTTSDKAQQPLRVDQTPMGWVDDGVTTDTSCKVK